MDYEDDNDEDDDGNNNNDDKDDDDNSDDMEVVFGQAVMFPATTALLSKWAPRQERSMLVGLALSGCQLGNAMILSIGGVLCTYAGWDSIFYSVGENYLYNQ